MKKVLILCSLLFLFTGCGEKNVLMDDFVISTIGKKNTEVEATFYYSDGDRTIYLVNLEEVQLVDENGETSLKDYVEKVANLEMAMDSVIGPLYVKEHMFDGGTRIYADDPEKQVTSSGITIISCRTMEGNKDYYIGPKDLNPEDIKDGYCGK